MQIKKLTKELEALRKIKSDEYGPFNKQMQAIADSWSILVGKKIRPHQVCLMYAAAKIVRANNGKLSSTISGSSESNSKLPLKMFDNTDFEMYSGEFNL